MRRILRLIVLGVFALVVYVLSERKTPAPGWTKITDATYVQGPHSDGDSIEAFVDGTRHVFRLYFVDTIERSAMASERRDDQGRYFGDPPLTQTETLALAREASALTRDALAKGFTLLTSWERVNPDSDNPSVRAFVQTRDGRDLAELLVENGLALIKGDRAQADHPDGRTARQIEQRLVDLEEQARERGVGGWVRRRAAREALPAGVFAASDKRGIEAQRGRGITVRGRVSRIGEAGGGRLVFLNFDGTGRDGFVAVLRDDRDGFPVGLPPGFPQSLERREIEVEGVLELFEGTPQIEIESGRQLRVLGP